MNDPYITLMDFADQGEREEVLGPLFAAAAKSDVPIFGPDRFAQLETKAKLTAAIKHIVHSKEDHVVNVLASADSDVALSLNKLGLNKSSGVQIPKLGLQSVTNEDKSIETPTTVAKFHTSRELHDMSHYSVLSCIPRTKPDSELFHNVMLRRAVDGYLFDCKKNTAVVANDKWLQGVWEWIAGKLRLPAIGAIYTCINLPLIDAEDSAKDDGMVSGSLDLSYMGVYTVWMNILGKHRYDLLNIGFAKDEQGINRSLAS